MIEIVTNENEKTVTVCDNLIIAIKHNNMGLYIDIYKNESTAENIISKQIWFFDDFRE